MKKRVGVCVGRLTPPGKAKPYMDALRKVGVQPVKIVPGKAQPLRRLDGLVLAGGTDVDPRRYGQKKMEQTQEPETERDALEIKLVREALRRDLPVLGICRGLQLFNVAHQGTLVQHLESTGVHQRPRVDAAHVASVRPGTRLKRILGVGECDVNSRHHQAVDRVGCGLRVSAQSPDGVVEAVERPDRSFAVAVQWHPEDLVSRDRRALKLFKAFANSL